MKLNSKKLFLIILVFWFIVNLLQSVFTEVISDEAYYFQYGKFLAWGYFDHPPMIALFTKISSLFFKGNLAVRFMTVLVQTLTLIIIWKIIDERKPDNDKVFSFFIISASIFLFSIYGFITSPDVPLLFFTSLFLYLYKNFLSDQNWKNVFLLSLSMAGLVYSKYQGVLVIGFIILSNLKILRAYKFWISGLFALILFFPHILWQTANDYPSIKFHIVSRSDDFRWKYILEYLPNQLASFNPLVFGAVIYIIIKNKIKDLFSRGLYFLTIGFIVFFWIMAIRGHVEPNWTIACAVPMIILIYNSSTNNRKIFGFVRKALLPSVFLLFALRLIVISDLKIVKTLGLNGKKEKYQFIESVAKDKPVLFLGSFVRPALYSFFTGKEGLAINSLFSRMTQFDIWQFEKKYNNKPAFICGFGEGDSKLYSKDGFDFFGYATDSLQTVNRIGVTIEPRLKILKIGDSLNLTMILKNNYENEIDFAHKNFPVDLCISFLNDNGINSFPISLQKQITVMKAGETITRTFSAMVPDIPPGKYRFELSLCTLFGPAINNSISEIRIVK